MEKVYTEMNVQRKAGGANMDPTAGLQILVLVISEVRLVFLRFF